MIATDNFARSLCAEAETGIDELGVEDSESLMYVEEL